MTLGKGVLKERNIAEVDSSYRSTLPYYLHTFVARKITSIGLFVSATIVVLLASLYYLQTMSRWTYAGFPLDDSWIHIEYARSIFEGRPWEYSAGYPSTGSTSPLWAIVLSLLFFLSSNSASLILQIYIVSGVLYALSAFLAGLIVNDYTNNLLLAYVAIIGFVLTPRLTWLMMSGMETPLFIFLILFGIYYADKPGWKYDLSMGVVGGLLFLARPEGVLFLLVGIPLRFLTTVKKRELNFTRLISLGGAILVACAIAVPWIFHCISVTGFPLPDTFYTKSGNITQSSITIWNEFWIRTFIEAPFTIIGLFGGILLVFKGKSYSWIFFIAMVFTYFLTIPYAVLVNNARYMTPLLSILVIISIVVVGMLTEHLRVKPPTLKTDLTYSIATTVLILIILIPTTPLFVRQADFFGNSVKNINEMQVTIGQWIYENTPPDAKFAIFDAGAIRFFGNRTVFDLARLITPELAHGNYTVHETFEWLRDQGCNYIISWRDWFRFTAIALHIPYTELFRITLDDNVICAGPEMSVFSLNWNRSIIWSAS